MLTRRRRQYLTIALTIGLICWSSAPMLGHEVPIHKAITDAAIDFLIAKRPELAACGADEVRLLLKHGVDHEDDFTFEVVPVGPFFFHFNSPLPLQDRVNPKSEFYADVAGTCNSSVWANGGQCSASMSLSPLLKLVRPLVFLVNAGNAKNTDRQSEFPYASVLSDLKSAPGTEAKARGLKGVGHLIHLLQDLTSPAHVRNDAHPHLPFNVPDLFGLPGLNDPSNFEAGMLDQLMASYPDAQRNVRALDVIRPLIRMPTESLRSIASPWTAFQELQLEVSSNFISEKDLEAAAALLGDSHADLFNAAGIRIARRLPGSNKLVIDQNVVLDSFKYLSARAVLWTASLLSYIHETEGSPLCEVNLKVDFGAGAVVSSPDPAQPERRIDCGRRAFFPGSSSSDCERSFPSGSVVTLTALPQLLVQELPPMAPFVFHDSGEFVGWVGACEGQGQTCTLTAGGGGSDAQELRTKAVFAKFPADNTLRGVPERGQPSAIDRLKLAEPIVNGNAVYLPGNWRVRDVQGDTSGYFMSIGTGAPFKLRRGFVRDLMFGADGEHDFLGVKPPLPRSETFTGEIKFWNSDDGLPPSKLRLVAIAAGESGAYYLQFLDLDDPSDVELTLMLGRLPE